MQSVDCSQQTLGPSGQVDYWL